MPYRFNEPARQIVSPEGTVVADVHGHETEAGRMRVGTMLRALNARDCGPALSEVTLADIDGALRDARARLRNAGVARMQALAIGNLAEADIHLATVRAEQATVIALQELLANHP